MYLEKQPELSQRISVYSQPKDLNAMKQREVNGEELEECWRIREEWRTYRLCFLLFLETSLFLVLFVLFLGLDVRLDLTLMKIEISLTYNTTSVQMYNIMI